MRLVAVQRPGWLQVYRFEAIVRVKPQANNDDPEQQELLGLVRSDARETGHDVQVFTDESKRRSLFADWTDEMICLRGAQGLR